MAAKRKTHRRLPIVLPSGLGISIPGAVFVERLDAAKATR